MKAPLFINRWLFSGKLTTLTELHIGDGNVGEIADRTEQAKKGAGQSDASTVCVDYKGTAYLPGSAIKGVLRARIVTSGQWDAVWDQLLGSPTSDANGSFGGKLEFFDAFWTGGHGPGNSSDHKPSEDDHGRPWWDHIRRTAVSVSNSLDRRTRTSSDGLLYHIEYVPPGETFCLEIGGDNLTEGEVGRVWCLLGLFNEGATLGAQQSNDWGRVSWEPAQARTLDAAGIEAWKKSPQSAHKGSRTIDLAIPATQPQACAGGMVFEIKLKFTSPWLVRDPRQKERAEKSKLSASAGSVPDAVPLPDEKGRPFISAKGVRGGLRSQAERILHTMRMRCEDHPSRIRSVDTLEQAKILDLAAKLVGASGWRAPITPSRFIVSDETEKGEIVHQEFVANDRFTGGVAGVQKFNAKQANNRTLCGTLDINIGRLRLVDDGLASLGLLALVLRDLEEGDIHPGSGAAKGLGECTGLIAIRGFAEDWKTHPDIVTSVGKIHEAFKLPEGQTKP